MYEALEQENVLKMAILSLNKKLNLCFVQLKVKRNILYTVVIFFKAGGV